MNLRAILALTLTAFSALAQTPADELQRGIFSQESRGDLDNAVTIFRKLAYSTLTPREIAANAQYRLSQSLLAKGDLSAAAREMERLERDFADSRTLIGNLARQTPRPSAAAASPKVPFEKLIPRLSAADFEGGPTTTFTGVITMIVENMFRSHVLVDVQGKQYMVQLPGTVDFPDSRFFRTKLNAADPFQYTARSPRSGSITDSGIEGLQALTIENKQGERIFDLSKMPK